MSDQHLGVVRIEEPEQARPRGQRYVDEFAGRSNMRELDTTEQMVTLVAAMAGECLLYKKLIAPNGLSSGARPPAEEA